MSASSRETVAPASTELTTPEKRIPSATTAVTATAVHVEREASVPTHTRHAPASPSAACDPSRVRIGPREVDEQQHRERAERGEDGEVRVPDHLLADRETPPA